MKGALEDQKRRNEQMFQNFELSLDQVEKNCNKTIQKWISVSLLKKGHAAPEPGQVRDHLGPARTHRRRSPGHREPVPTKIEVFLPKGVRRGVARHQFPAGHRTCRTRPFGKGVRQSDQSSVRYQSLLLGAIKKELEIQKQNREGFQQHLENLIKNLHQNFMGKIEDLRKERISKQDNMLRLIESIVSKIKQDLLDSDEDDD